MLLHLLEQYGIYYLGTYYHYDNISFISQKFTLLKRKVLLNKFLFFNQALWRDHSFDLLHEDESNDDHASVYLLI